MYVQRLRTEFINCDEAEQRYYTVVRKTRIFFYMLLLLVLSKPDAEITWFRGQSRFYPEDSDFYHFECENGWYRLVIDSVRPQDVGEWRCLATNSYGQCISFCTLNVLGR